ncbi:hypothetical protein Tco_1405713 [Tanacetum coccineum]
MVAELKKHKWELPKEFLDLPGQISSVQSRKLTASPTEEEKKINPVTEYAELAHLADLMGIDMVEEYHKKKLLEDGSKEVISNLKVSDLHLFEWREVIQACPNKSEKGWKTIYGLVKTRLDQLTQTEQELKIDLN